MALKSIYGWGAVGVVLLGIFTNALWEAMKPGGEFLLKALLNVSILGIEKFKDNIYQEIARGFHEGASVEIFIFAHNIFFAFAAATVFALLLLRHKVLTREGIKPREGILDRVVKFHDKLPYSRFFVWFVVGYMLFVGTIFILTATREVYINRAVTHFEQLMTISAPFLAETEKGEIRSNFAQIEKKEDYTKVIFYLENLARDNNKIVPKFMLIF